LGKPAGLTIASPRHGGRASAPSSSAAICSGRPATIGAARLEGLWGDNPPYQAPTFIPHHHAGLQSRLEGGTTFYFVTEGIEAALAQAKPPRATST